MRGRVRAGVWDLRVLSMLLAVHGDARPPRRLVVLSLTLLPPPRARLGVKRVVCTHGIILRRRGWSQSWQDGRLTGSAVVPVELWMVSTVYYASSVVMLPL